MDKYVDNPEVLLEITEMTKRNRVSTQILEEAIKRLQEAQQETDTERAHPRADDVLCDLLACLGYEDVVVEYRKVEKWYA